MLGHQLLIDLFDCDPVTINDPEAIEGVISALVKCLEADIIQIVTHRFVPQGISCLALISASHISIHTWPEHRFTTVDLFSCKSKIQIFEVEKVLKEAFLPREIVYNEIQRGTTLYSSLFKER